MNDTAIPNIEMPAEATMRQAVATRDERYNGVFV